MLESKGRTTYICAPPVLSKQWQNFKKLRIQHLTLFGQRRCLHAPSEDTSSERQGYIIDVETFMQF